MAAFGISFPKLSLCRSTTSKVDPNMNSPSTTTTSTRTLSLSIKNVPSQPLHYDISTSTTKKKPTSMTTILAIDGETKQLPKNWSVFNELQLDDGHDDINERRKQIDSSNAIAIPSSSSPMRNIHPYPDIQVYTTADSKPISNDFKNADNLLMDSHRSNHTFTPPTTSLSPHSSSNDLHVTSSSFSVDLPQLKYAIEKFLLDDDDPVYQFVDEFPSGSFFSHQESHHQQNEPIDDVHHLPMHEKNTQDEGSSRYTPVSNSMKWYVSELRIHRPLIYQTQWTHEQVRIPNRKLSHSVNDLKHIYNFSNCPKNDSRRRTNPIAYSTLSLQNFMNQQYRSSMNLQLHHSHSDENNQHLSPLTNPRTIDRSIRKDDTMIRNESVKKKLFDILNDDELENACLEDMSEEFEKLSLDRPPRRELAALNSFSSSSDDALYSSPPTEPQHLPLPMPPPLLLSSSSCDEILSSNTNKTTERFLGRSRLITTSLDKIPMNNHQTYEQLSSTCLLRPSWYTSPSPQWRTDDQLPMISILKEYASENHTHRNGSHSNRLINTKVSDYDIKENNNIPKSIHHRKEQKHISYSLMNTSTAFVDNSSTVLPLIQDKSSNLLMFI